MERYEQISNIIIRFIGLSGKTRSEISAKIKNYTKEDRDLAIGSLVKEKLVTQSVDVTGTAGRKPVRVRLTDKGIIALSELGDDYIQLDTKSAWSTSASK